MYEDPSNPNRQPAGISGSVCINHLWLVVAGGGGMSDFWKDYEPEPTRPAPMTKEEALAFDLALEALEESVDLVREDYENAKKLYSNYPSRQARLLGLEDGLSKHEAAITAIKQARSAPVQSCYCPNCEAMGKELAALKAQPAPVQEPQRYSPDGEGGMEVDSLGAYVKLQDVTTPPAQPAPAPGYCKHCKQYSIEEPLPAAQRQWVGLDDDDIYDCDEANACRSALAYAIEAKLKEKNHGN